MTKRVAILWWVLAVLIFTKIIWSGWTAEGGFWVTYITMMYYGENILAKLNNKEGEK